MGIAQGMSNNRCNYCTINTKIFARQKNPARNSLRKNYKNDFPALIQNLATVVWFLCNIHATPRGAHGSYKKIGAAMNSRKNYKKKFNKKSREGN